MKKLSMRNTGLLPAVLGLLMAGGCGSAHPASVQGTVTLDAEPLAGADVTFHPVGQGALAQGRSDTRGRYTLGTGQRAGLAPGRYRVTVVATRMEPDPSSDELMPRLLTPSEYASAEQTPLQFDVARGNRRIDLELTSR